MVKLHLFMSLAMTGNQLLGLAEAGCLYSDGGDQRELDLAADRIGAGPYCAKRALVCHYELSGAALKRAKQRFVLAGHEELAHDMRWQGL